MEKADDMFCAPHNKNADGFTGKGFLRLRISQLDNGKNNRSKEMAKNIDEKMKYEAHEQSKEVALQEKAEAVAWNEMARSRSEEGVRQGKFEDFVGVIAALRSENGCPWDKEQTFDSLKSCMINEMTEAIAAIDIYQETGNAANFCEELGDVLLQVVLQAQIAQEAGLFSIEDVVCQISQKMIRRHPHVFGAEENQKEILDWEAIKKKEKRDRTSEMEKREKEAFTDASMQIISHLANKERMRKKG